jgi:hypothetical protein
MVILSISFIESMDTMLFIMNRQLEERMSSASSQELLEERWEASLNEERGEELSLAIEVVKWLPTFSRDAKRQVSM